MRDVPEKVFFVFFYFCFTENGKVHACQQKKFTFLKNLLDIAGKGDILRHNGKNKG